VNSRAELFEKVSQSRQKMDAGQSDKWEINMLAHLQKANPGFAAFSLYMKSSSATSETLYHFYKTYCEGEENNSVRETFVRLTKEWLDKSKVNRFSSELMQAITGVSVTAAKNIKM
jgi:hypothetical protein